MLNRKNTLRTAALMMVCLSLVVIATGTIVSYRSALVDEESKLLAIAQLKSHEIEAIFKHSSNGHTPEDHSHAVEIANCPTCSTGIELVIDILHDSENLQVGLGKGVELVVGSREGDNIRFLLHRNNSTQQDRSEPLLVPWKSDSAEPMQLALAYMTGTIEARDYRGDNVLAAYAPVELLDWGVVAKIDMVEMRAPFITSARNSLILTTLAIFIGLIVLRKRLKPLIHEAQYLGELADQPHQQAIAELESQKYALDQHAIVSTTDIRGIITYANDNFCKISGYTRKEFIGQSHRMIKSDDEHDHDFYHDMWKTIARGYVWKGEIKNRAKSGSHYWVEATIVPLKDDQGKITQYIAIRTDITERKEQEAEVLEINDSLTSALHREKTTSSELEQTMEKLEAIATTDKLTGLPNRGAFLDRLEWELKQSRRSGTQFAVLFFDFDRFKVVNDSLGHEVGDDLLCDIAGLFCDNLRDTDIAARIGGDEFVVMLTNLSQWSDAKIKANELLELFAKPHTLQGHRVVSTASIGLVTNNREYESASEMIRDSDAAMYQAKESGKGRVVIFDKVMHEKAIDRLKLEEDLHTALEKEQFMLLYQPIVSLETGKISGFEALIRWNHPQRNLVSPLDFIPIAEETGLISDIGKWVLYTAARQIAQWNQRLDLDQRISVNINLSKHELLNNSIVNDILECQRSFNLQSGDLKLEVTESAIVDERSNIIPVLVELRKHGFLIAMDDFGTGLSSLGALHDYPIDILKIDQSFIRALDNDRSLLAVVASITTLADNLGITTVAEGLESKDIVGALQSVGCTWAQGYYFAKPLSPSDAEAYLLEQDPHCSLFEKRKAS